MSIASTGTRATSTLFISASRPPLLTGPRVDGPALLTPIPQDAPVTTAVRSGAGAGRPFARYL